MYTPSNVILGLPLGEFQEPDRTSSLLGIIEPVLEVVEAPFPPLCLMVSNGGAI